jgi:hypothetical protein
MNLRSFGIYRQAPSAEIDDELTTLVSQHVLAVWRGEKEAEISANERSIRQFFKTLHLDTAGLAANARSSIESKLGGEPGRALKSWLDERGLETRQPAKDAFDAVDQLFGRTESGSCPVNQCPLLQGHVSDAVGPLSDRIREELGLWILRQIDNPRQRLSGARRALRAVEDQLARILEELTRIQAAISDRLIQIRASSDAAGSGPSLVDEYFLMCLDQLTVVSAECVVRTVLSDAKQQSDRIVSMGREIEQIATAVGRAAEAAASTPGNERKAMEREQFRSKILAKLPELAAVVDAQLQAQHIDGCGGLMATIMNGGRPRAQLSAKLHELSKRAVKEMLMGGFGERRADENDLHSALAMATPSFLEYGGQRRVLAVVPNDGTGANPAELGIACSTIRGQEPHTLICVEADKLSLEHIALEIVERRRDRVEFAKRVHCRADIEWTPLIVAEEPSTASGWETGGSRPTQSPQAMCQTLVL